MTEDLRQRHIHERGPVEPWELAHDARRRHWRRLGARARSAVAKAVSRGVLLALPNPGVYCVDCGARAAAYDHRDYARPLDVRAVCAKCNVLRGPAKHAPPFVELEPIEGGDNTEDFTLPLTETLHCVLDRHPKQGRDLTRDMFLGLLTAP